MIMLYWYFYNLLFLFLEKALAISDEPVKINGLVIALIVFLVVLILAVIIAAIIYVCFGKKGLYKLSDARK